MTQFSSTLYPQTNPTNPALLAFRSNPFSRPMDVRVMQWLWYLDSQFSGEYTQAQAHHARRVLTRLANLSG